MRNRKHIKTRAVIKNSVEINFMFNFIIIIWMMSNYRIIFGIYFIISFIYLSWTGCQIYLITIYPIPVALQRQEAFLRLISKCWAPLGEFLFPSYICHDENHHSLYGAASLSFSLAFYTTYILRSKKESPTCYQSWNSQKFQFTQFLHFAHPLLSSLSFMI